MIKSQSIMRYFVVIATVLLSACSGMDTRESANAGNVATVINRDDLSLEDSQNEFEALLNTLKNQPTADGKVPQSRSVLNKYWAMAGNREVKSRLLRQYSQWKGVRYRLGGDNLRGVDCSAFVKRTFFEQFGIELPRSTSGQQTVGHKISRDELRIGDLVLFRSGSTGRHVGIYIGNNQFVHASTRKGVTISSMDNPYWKKHYSQARRIFNYG